MERLEEYYFITDVASKAPEVRYTKDCGHPSDVARWYKCNYFGSRQEAQQVADSIKRVRESVKMLEVKFWIVDNYNFRMPAVHPLTVKGYTSEGDARLVEAGVSAIFRALQDARGINPVEAAKKMAVLETD